MTQQKTKIWLAVLVVSLIANIAFWLMPSKQASLSYDQALFTIADTSAVQSVTMTSANGTVAVARKDNGWIVNDRYPIDAGLHNLLLSILKNVEVKRPADINTKETTKVNIVKDGETISFEIAGNANKTKTYFIKDGKSYEVEIPGYRDYLATLFELHEDQWRSRLVADASWRTIQQLNLHYANDDTEDVEIKFAGQFFDVKDVAPLDSNAVVEYLNQFQFWQANELISTGRFARYDSLSQTTPLAQLTLETISTPDPMTFRVFPLLPGERYHLVQSTDGQMMIFDQRRIHQLLVKKQDFKLKD